MINLFQKKKKEIPHTVYDPARYKPVLRCSICTGEQVAGFKDKETGKFIEIDLIRNDNDLKEFMAKYEVDNVEKVW